jgi:hypothetical protein
VIEKAIAGYLYYLYDVLKRNQIFIKNENKNLSTSLDLFYNFLKTFENLEKTERCTQN